MMVRWRSPLITTSLFKLIATIKVWDIKKGNLWHTLEGHSDLITSVAMSPNGKIVISGSGDKTIKVWDIKTGTLLRTLEGHSDPITSVAMSLNSDVVISGDRHRTIMAWGVR